MSEKNLILTTLVACLLAVCGMAHAQQRPAEWLCYRGNPSQDGHSPATGKVTEPAIVWKHFVGTMDSLVTVAPGSGEAAIPLPQTESGDYAAALGDVRWGLMPAPGMVEGRLQPVQNGSFHTYANILTESPDLEKVEVKKEGTVVCSAWRNNAWEKVWESEAMDFGNTVTALPIVADFDADGKLDVAFLPWWHLVVLDAQTGALKDQCAFTDGRSYGFFGAYDLDGDGKLEFVVQADFAKHIDVLGYREGKLVLLWKKDIELDISNPEKILRVMPNPVADMEGDGKPEVLVNLFNDTGDGRWHATIHDGLKGTIKADLADECIVGAADYDDDGKVELMTTAAKGNGVPEFGPIRLRGFKDGDLAVLWELDGSGWATADRAVPPNVNTGATYGQRDALWCAADGRFTALLRQPVEENPRDVRLVSAVWVHGQVEPGMTVAGSNIEALAIDAKENVLLRCHAAPGSSASLAVRGGKAEVAATMRRGVPEATPVVVWPKEATRPYIVVQGHDEELVAFHPPVDKGPAQPLWRISGRGQSTTWPASLGPVVADMYGDGHRQLIYATGAPEGCARLVVKDVVSGNDLFYRDFPEIPGAPPVWNAGGIVLWQTGHFTSPENEDIVVTIRRSMMHSEETLLLSGKNGAELWRCKRQVTNMHSRGVGGTPFAIADFDGDGLDDLASFYPSLFYILKGNTGGNVLLMNAVWSDVPDKPVYWGQPIAGDFENDGKQTVMMVNGMTGLVRPDGELVWWDKASQANFAIGDFDGSGKLQAVGMGFEDGIRWYDTATGTVQWRLTGKTNPVASSAVSAGIEGLNRDAALFTSGDTLFCIGVDSVTAKPTLIWQQTFPAVVGPPAIANLEPQGGASIVIVGADGYVYCVNQKP